MIDVIPVALLPTKVIPPAGSGTTQISLLCSASKQVALKSLRFDSYSSVMIWNARDSSRTVLSPSFTPPVSSVYHYESSLSAQL